MPQFTKEHRTITSRIIIMLLLSLLIIRIGTSLADTAPDVTPAPEDMQQTEAIETAEEILNAHFDDMAGILSAASFEAWYGYIDAAYDEPTWMVEFSNPDRFAGVYRVVLSRQGDLLYYNAPNAKPYAPGEDELSGATFATPGPNDISEEQVVAIAMDALYEIGDFQTRMHQITTEAYFIYSNRYNDGFEPVWLIYFYQNDVQVQKMLLGYDGSYIQTAAAEKQFTRTSRAYTKFSEVFDYQFYSMTYVEKAAFSDQWLPIVNAYIQENPYFPDRRFRMFYQATRQVFGLPEEGHISQQQATKIAQKAIVALGENEQTMEQRKIGYSFDVTDSENPLWVLVIYRPISNDTSVPSEDFHVYEVKIDAIDGDVVTTIMYVDENSFDGYYF